MHNQIDIQVRTTAMWTPVWNKLVFQLREQLWEQISNQLTFQLRDQLWEQLWDQLKDDEQ
jgi:uncharacterized membrane protein